MAGESVGYSGGTAFMAFRRWKIFVKGGKFSRCERTRFVDLNGNRMAHCHLSVVVQTTMGSNGASAESCIKFENFLLVRVELS